LRVASRADRLVETYEKAALAEGAASAFAGADKAFARADKAFASLDKAIQGYASFFLRSAPCKQST
jgi:hypothetical protein